MNGTKRARRGRPAGTASPSDTKRMPPAVRIASILMVSCAWFAMPRHASAEQGTGAKLASQASAIGGQLRDATIVSRARAALVAERGLASGDIDVQVRGRVAELTGTVPDEQQRATAVRIVRGIDGVRSVRDELQVRRK
ncbi:BON domain-containing protein [Burkholderia dolosa]|uniref:BON domain-containing protein n=1 Tax=Burkholderia dolosa TaxID=152500 RepID=A0A892IBE4_9BURK|nr:MULTISPECIES: BON domain-containing protein [Burkholderia]AKE05910.1 transporter [Burkholderia cepacia]AJY09318.1 BON domain protein [Burkholderia dolosa AU0158]AYZ93759.1 BON domain-containing protein [Burkholderia dolosa]ETP62514.1 transporter [Burkholderia dolosa PC543]MBR8420669.1 BON domain-containing protein [Burkholderia dolosa]